jgi:hypothetical protein
MGNCSTPYAVTDDRARVYDVTGIRVVDIRCVYAISMLVV